MSALGNSGITNRVDDFEARIAQHKKRVLWKTRNFAGFPAFSHILGIGQWCIVRVLKSAEYV